MTSLLSNVTGGRWRVSTATSDYLLDLDTRTATRVPHADTTIDGDDFYCVALRKDGQPWLISNLVVCEVGKPMELIAFGIADNPAVMTHRMTTPVQAITEEAAKP